MSIKIKMSPVEVIEKRLGINKGGEAELFMAQEARRLMDPYVPKDQGTLKNTATVDPGKVTYVQVYSQRQYWEHKGSGLRGPEWDKRMMADRGPELARAVSRFVKGK